MDYKNIFNKLDEMDKRLARLEEVIRLAMEGLNAVYRYGDSQGIAEKTLEQIKKVDKEEN